MKKLTFAQMSNKTIQFHLKSLPFYIAYNECLRPCLDDRELRYQLELSLSRPTIIIRDSKGLLVTNNFELFTKLKSRNNYGLEHRSVSYDEIDRDHYLIQQGFYELMECINRHAKSILLKDKYKIIEVYNQLANTLIDNDCQKLFEVNKFSVVTYCELIGISESTFYRCKRA